MSTNYEVGKATVKHANFYEEWNLGISELCLKKSENSRDSNSYESVAATKNRKKNWT